jgi:beta-galactosidase
MQSNRLTQLYRQLWHGADYNYEQWLETPQVLEEDFRLMKQTGCTAMSVGIFSWAMLEPADGQYAFDWLDTLMNRLHENGIKAILATPSAAHPAWLSKKYSEVLRVREGGRREPHRFRQNFCRTSPIFRIKCKQINTLLAQRYADHPALLLWHVSNEYGSTPCHCANCYAGFRQWLKARYGTLEAVNRAWWATFWSHQYTDWDEIEPVDGSVHGLMLDWMRYNSDQVLDFYRAEMAPLREITPNIPITTNFMRPDVGLNYWQIAGDVDIACWDSYPEWHVHDDMETGLQTAFYHDLHRGYKHGAPFYLMESSPAQTNWQPLSRAKRPGMVKLASLQAVAHGALGVNYFQWRQSRGGEEKFHGAVVLHRDGEASRTFRDVVSVGKMLGAVPDLAHARTPAEVGIIYDFENGWALNLAKLPRSAKEEYQATVLDHYRPFWQSGIPVDVLGPEASFDPYRVIVAPMLYLLREETAARLAKFVSDGGTLVTTYLTGLVNESDLCYLGGYPKPLDEVLGIFMTEFDTFGAGQTVAVVSVADNSLGLQLTTQGGRYAELVTPLTAEVLVQYDGEFYKGNPALTVNGFGAGKAYHLAARFDAPALSAFYQQVTTTLGIRPSLPDALPHGVSVHVRETEQRRYLFLMNFTEQEQMIKLDERPWDNLLTEDTPGQQVHLPPFGAVILGSKK